MNGNWLLPDYLADILPAQARQIEDLRRKLLDLFRTFGFETVSPPMLEYIESLLTGAGKDLSLKTFKLVDQLSGRTLGLRADMTPQITRIDAHLLNRPGVTRLCYCGPVLHARPAGLVASREQLQIGAEIYGYAGIEADIEIIRLAMQSLKLAGVSDGQLVLCHDGLVQAIVNSDPAAKTRADEILALLRDKDLPGIASLRGDGASGTGVSEPVVAALELLPKLYGGAEVLERAASLSAFDGVSQALESLKTLVAKLSGEKVSLDLADVGAYGYHSGVTFSIYAADWHDALVRGGRYDNVGVAFGRARAATGFSMDLIRLARSFGQAKPAAAILAPAVGAEDKALAKAVAQLRTDGEIVVQLLPGESAEHDEFVFDRELARDGQQWVVRSLKPTAKPNSNSKS
ncbi:MAG: ATP phosphoribosyltransferase regulatory subunit [Burkholderiaceae bacterium]|nr:ATP phosphoribosyltransferase regulatory subunit [Burkholderiaceae bacterium]